MFIHNKSKTSLLKYWTTRYFLTLLSGLLIIGIISTYMINYYSTTKRLDSMKLLAEEISDRIVYSDGKLLVDRFLPIVLDKRERFLRLESKPLYLILDKNKKIVFGKTGKISIEILQREIVELEEDESFEDIDFRGRFYIIERTIENNNEPVGWVVILLPKTGFRLNEDQFKLLLIMLISLGLLGWGVLYFLTKKLSEPIQEVADAAKKIVEGNYDITLKKHVKEKEISELIISFKDMAERLRQLELIRTELLAGVTHELKTPVTSISGLIQAVNDKVVTEEEAREFIEISSKEAKRLEKMLEDLLDFNSFAVGAIKVNKQEYNLNHLIKEITYQWQIVQENEKVRLNTILPTNNVYSLIDPLRVQQIMINLLNNSMQAIGDWGTIEVFLYEDGKNIKIDVKDNGVGIEKEEQQLIFERFYRGKNKKHKYHGLGLGLSYSKLIAKALDGDLILKDSSKIGTTFTLILPMNH